MVDSDRPQSRRTYLKTLGAAGAVGMSGLSGCTLLGGGGGGEGITIAATVPETGQFSSLGEAVKQGYELGVSRMDEQLDEDVELLMEDDESDPEVVRQELQQMTSNNQVDMIWGSFSSLLATAGSAFAEQQDLPFLAVAFASEEPHLNNNYEWTFAPFPKSRDVAISGANMLDNLDDPPQNIGLWEMNSSWGAEQADAWEQTFSDAGYDIVYREQYQAGAEDFSSLISQSDSQDVEAVFGNPIPPDGIAMVQQMKSSGWAPDLLHFVRAADPQAWWSALGEDGAYAQMAPGWLPGMQGGGNQELLEAYDELDDKPTEVPLAMVGASYGLTQTANQAMQAAGSAEPDAIRDALLSEEFDTVLGQFEFEDNGMPAEGEITAPIGQWWEERQRLVHPPSDSEYAMETQYPIPSWDER
jgi:branched-chain amino acid transport system substrate-binding protein